MELRDPIHSFIEFDDREERLINSRAFQRLRRIRQLAMSMLAYPGAHHTRFEHSLGAMHIAGRLADRLGLSPEEARQVRLAALLHDVGHGPYSHVSEHLFEQFAPSELTPHDGRFHERITLDLLRNDPQLERIAGREELDAAAAILEHRHPRKLLSFIVSGPMDADKLDYLLRDSHFAGVQYGIFDLARIISEARAFEVEGDEVLGISEKGVWAAEQLLFAKYHMFKQVYCHKLRAVTDAMLIRGIRLAIEERLPGVAELFRYRHEPAFLEAFLETDDESLAAAILSAPASSLARRYFLRLRHRCLLKRIYHRLLDAGSQSTTAGRFLGLGDDERARLEKLIADETGLDAREVLLDVRGSAPTASLPPARDEILVEKAGQPARLTEVSDLFAGQAPSYEALAVSVYIPLDDDDRGVRRGKAGELAERVRRVLETN